MILCLNVTKLKNENVYTLTNTHEIYLEQNGVSSNCQTGCTCEKNKNQKNKNQIKNQ